MKAGDTAFTIIISIVAVILILSILFGGCATAPPAAAIAEKPPVSYLCMQGAVQVGGQYQPAVLCRPWEGEVNAPTPDGTPTTSNPAVEP